MVNSVLVDTDGTCPHCGRALRFVAATEYLPDRSSLYGDMSMIIASGEEDSVSVCSALCPSCKKPVIRLFHGTFADGTITSSRYVYPIGFSRFIAPEVPEKIREDFQEAVDVLPISEKASAALSRRCLQNVLIEKGGVRASDSLSKQIDQVLPSLPSYISKDLDAIRNIGNFAAHPMKDTNTREIIDVEPGEAEWNLDVLEELFDHYYTKPEKSRQKRQALNEKLESMGKPPMKQP